MAYQEITRDKSTHSSGPPRPLRKPVDRLEDDATGINVEGRKPIDARMPHMPPA
jgi:hypothetical protein